MSGDHAAEVAAEWWRDAFGEDYCAVYGHRDDASAAAEVAALLPRLRDAPGPVLDAGCGHGRHLACLRAAGVTAFGVDGSAPLLARARARPLCRGTLLRGDLRAPALAPGAWGAVLLLFTSFGYDDDAANAAQFARLAALLAPGGWLLLDLPDAAAVAAGLVAESRRDGPDGLVIHERRRLCDRRVEKTVELVAPGRPPRRWIESVRLYQPEEIAALAAASGLLAAPRWPGLRGAHHDEGRQVHWLGRQQP